MTELLSAIYRHPPFHEWGCESLPPLNPEDRAYHNDIPVTHLIFKKAEDFVIRHFRVYDDNLWCVFPQNTYDRLHMSLHTRASFARQHCAIPMSDEGAYPMLGFCAGFDVAAHLISIRTSRFSPMSDATSMAFIMAQGTGHAVCWIVSSAPL